MCPILSIQWSENCRRTDLRGLLWYTLRILLALFWSTVRRDGPFCSKTLPVSLQALVQKRHRSVNRCCLVRVHLIKLASNTGVGFQLCQPHNTIHFLFNWSKTGRNSTVKRHAHEPRTKPLLSGKMCESYYPKWNSPHFSSRFHFRHIMFYVTVI
jgi:hypothetical protein